MLKPFLSPCRQDGDRAGRAQIPAPVASPIPEDAPVMIATFPSMAGLVFIFMVFYTSVD